MNNDLLAYLQKDTIGKVIASGLADVYTHQPQAPVKYLAAWLKKYSANQKRIAELGKQQTLKGDSLKVFNSKVEEYAKTAAKIKQEQTAHTTKIQNFKKRVANHEYQEELMAEELPEFIEKELLLTGAYIGYLNHPVKEITQDDEQENSHLNTAIPKLINYIGSSKSHKELMHGKTLPLDKGVSAAAIALSLEDPVPAEDGTVQHKEKYVYIPNVVKAENVHYFRLPKLGSYITLPLTYNSYLTEHIFDVALQSRQKYLEELKEFNKARDEELKEIEAEKQAAEQKVTELTEKNADEAALEPFKTQLAEINKRYKEKIDEKFGEQHVQLPTEKREFLVCGDTLGKDKEIPEKDRLLLVELTKHFATSWEQKEKELLNRDVEYQISIQSHLDRSADVVLQHLDKITQISAEAKASFDEIEDQQIRQYKKSAWELDVLKKQLRQGPEYLSTFFKLKNFRVIKFKEVIQAILYFLSYKKEDINLQGRTTLNWKKVRATYLYANTFFATLDYNPQGPKTHNYPKYCKISHILQILEKYNEADLFHYNVGLGAVVRLIKKQLAQRQANVQLRRTQKENERKHRNLILEQNEKLAEDKRAALEKHKQSLVGEDLEAFKEEEWSSKYDEENPLKEVPAEVVDDVDNDF